MTATRIELEFMGSEYDGGHLRLADLIRKLKAVQESLLEIERQSTHSSDSKIVYRVAGLSHFGPTRVTLEAISDAGQDYVNAVVGLFRGKQATRKQGAAHTAAAGTGHDGPTAEDLGLGDQGQMGG